MDGVGNSSLYFMNLFKSFADVDLVANYSNIPFVINFKEYLKKHNFNNILFYHYSTEDLNIKLLLELKFKKRIIYYHGITPPKFFPIDSNLFKSCKKGLSDINLLVDFDLYLSNSTASKNQFFNHFNTNFLDYENFVNMPPVDIFSKDSKTYKIKSQKSELDFYYCGTLINHKNVNLLLELFNGNTNKKFNLSIFTSFSKEDSFNILGEKRYKEYLKNRINFFHKLEDENMNINLQKMNCFITLSLHEGFCIPLFDAINNFKPVLSFPLKCLVDYFPKNYKYISKVDDLSNMENKYFYNLEHIETFRDFIRYKSKDLTKTGLDLIISRIE